MSAPESESGAAGFLYPFLDAAENDPQTLLADLASSARAKAQESSALQQATLARCDTLLDEAADALAASFAAGGRMFTFGNGGSSTDAATLAGLFASPPDRPGADGRRVRPLPAWCLAADQAVLTALGNDVGFELVFSRQLIAHGRAGDVAVALSTSGSSDDLTAALAEATRRGMVTLGFAGYDGGRMASSPDVRFCFVVASQSVHRIQESQALLGYELWSRVQDRLVPARAGAVTGGPR